MEIERGRLAMEESRCETIYSEREPMRFNSGRWSESGPSVCVVLMQINQQSVWATTLPGSWLQICAAHIGGQKRTDWIFQEWNYGRQIPSVCISKRIYGDCNRPWVSNDCIFQIWITVLNRTCWLNHILIRLSLTMQRQICCYSGLFDDFVQLSAEAGQTTISFCWRLL